MRSSNGRESVPDVLSLENWLFWLQVRSLLCPEEWQSPGKPYIKEKKRKTKIGLVSLPPSIPIFRKQRDHTNSRAERTPPTLANFHNHPNLRNYTNVRNFGNFSRLLEKRRRKKSVSISLLTSGAEGEFR
jgi:hypothetical protein